MLTTAEFHNSNMALWVNGHVFMTKAVMNTWPLTQRVLPPWSLTSSRKTSALWCCVHTTPNWLKRLGDSWRWERLMSSQQVTDLPTAYNIKVIGELPYLQWPPTSRWCTKLRKARSGQVTHDCWNLVGVMLCLHVLCSRFSLDTLQGIPRWTANQG